MNTKQAVSRQGAKGAKAFLLLACAAFAIGAGQDGFGPEELAVTAPMAAAGATTPNYGSELQRNVIITDTTSVFYLSNSVSSATRLVLLVLANNLTVASVSDSAGNSWTVHGTSGNDGNASQGVSVISTHTSSALTTSSQITITWSAANYGVGAISLVDLSGCAASGQPDVAASNSAYAASVSLSATTVAANTVCVGMVSLDTDAQTYGSGSWSSVGALLDAAGRRGYPIYKVNSSAASQNPGGSWTATSGQANCWVAFK